MEYRELGRTGIKVSVFSVGTWQTAGPLTLDGKADGFPDIGRKEAVALIRGCQDLGINSIDSAEIYGNGEGERRIGEAIRGQRDRWVVSTKFGIRCGARGERITDASPPTIRGSLEGSLRRLETDYVDIFLYHSPPEERSMLEGRDVLERLKQEGKLRAYGISTNDPTVLASLLELRAAQVVMVRQSLRTHPARLLGLCRDHELGVMVRGALASGLLSGKYFARVPTFSSDDFRSRGAYLARQYALYDHVRPRDMSMLTFALRYLLDLPLTHTIVLGGKSIEDYRSALLALGAPRLSAARKLVLRSVQRTLELKGRASRLKKRIISTAG